MAAFDSSAAWVSYLGEHKAGRAWVSWRVGVVADGDVECSFDDRPNGVVYADVRVPVVVLEEHPDPTAAYALMIVQAYGEIAADLGWPPPPPVPAPWSPDDGSAGT